MKMKIMGLTAAALLLGSSIGFATASSPLIGAKVQGIFTLQKADGTKIGDAVIINGSTYAPVRALSEATGTELKVEGKTIILGDTVETSPAIGETTQAEPVTSAPAVTLTQEERDILTRRITNGERGLLAAQEDLVRTQERLAVTTDAAEIQRLTKRVAEIEAGIKGAQKALDADKARLAAAGE